MNISLIILLSLFVVVFSGFLFIKATGSLSPTRINMISYIFWVDFVAYSFIGTVLIFTLQDSSFNKVIDGLTGGVDTRFRVWLFVAYTIISFPIGMLISNFLFRYKANEQTLFNQKAIQSSISEKDSFLRYPLYALTALCALNLIYVFYSIGFIPFVKIFTVTSEIEVMQLRASIDNSFPGNVYLKNILGLTILPILSFAAFAYYDKTKSVLDLFWFLSLFAMSVLMLTYNVAKSPVVRYMLGFFFYYIYTRGKIKSGKFLIAGIGVTVFLVAFFTIIGKKDGGINLLLSLDDSGISGRVLVSQISSLYRHLEIFPNIHPHLEFSSLSGLFAGGEASSRSARIVLETVSPSWVEQGYGGVYNTLFIGEAYANFGLMGIIFSPLYVGFIIKSFHTFLIRSKKTPMVLGIIVFYSYRSNLTGGFNEYIYNPILWATIIIFIFIFYTKNLIYKQRVGFLPWEKRSNDSHL